MISNRIPKKDVVKFPEIDRAHIYKPRDYLYRSISVKASFFFFFFSIRTIHHVKVRFDSATMTSIQTSIASRSSPPVRAKRYFFIAHVRDATRRISGQKKKSFECVKIASRRRYVRASFETIEGSRVENFVSKKRKK